MTSPGEDHQFAFHKIARQFAHLFGVSNEAMRVRLENLGLLLRHFPKQHAFQRL
jgi:Zn-dependent peptidase ImmA (M78 family)